MSLPVRSSWNEPTVRIAQTPVAPRVITSITPPVRASDLATSNRISPAPPDASVNSQRAVAISVKRCPGTS